MERKMTKKWLIFCLTVCLIMPLVAGCGEIVTRKDDGKIHVVTTLFPYYDFVKQIGGDRVDVQLIVPAGMDTHSFEPTAKDMVAIGEADLFLYNGGTMESWVPKVLEAAEGKNVKTLKMMDYVEVVAEETVEGMQEEDGDNRGGLNHNDDAGEQEGEDEEPDEHIWTSPLNCVKLVEQINRTLQELDPDNRGTYQRNTTAYQEELKNLDMEIRKIVASGKRKELVFGDRFPLRYFTDTYGLTYRAAFPGCSSDMEPSAETIAYLIDRVEKNHIPVVLKVEMSSSKVSETISESTEAEVMTFSSCHTVTRQQFDDGVTYLSLMEENVGVLKNCLN